MLRLPSFPGVKIDMLNPDAGLTFSPGEAYSQKMLLEIQTLKFMITDFEALPLTDSGVACVSCRVAVGNGVSFRTTFSLQRLHLHGDGSRRRGCFVGGWVVYCFTGLGRYANRMTRDLS